MFGKAISVLSTEPRFITNPTKLQEVLSLWTSPFTTVSVMANRLTPLHCDVNSRHPWFDILVTVGPYSEAHLDLSGIGVELGYESSTVVGLASKVLRHGVEGFDGN